MNQLKHVFSFPLSFVQTFLVLPVLRQKLKHLKHLKQLKHLEQDHVSCGSSRDQKLKHLEQNHVKIETFGTGSRENWNRIT